MGRRTVPFLHLLLACLWQLAHTFPGSPTYYYYCYYYYIVHEPPRCEGTRTV